MPSPLSGAHDLLDLFHLLPVYDTYVRPYVTLPTTTPASPKGKEREPSGGTTSVGFSIGGVRIGGVAVAGAAAEDKARKVKMEKTYTHLVADIPGECARLAARGARVGPTRPFSGLDPSSVQKWGCRIWAWQIGRTHV